VSGVIIAVIECLEVLFAFCWFGRSSFVSRTRQKNASPEERKQKAQAQGRAILQFEKTQVGKIKLSNVRKRVIILPAFIL